MHLHQLVEPPLCYWLLGYGVSAAALAIFEHYVLAKLLPKDNKMARSEAPEQNLRPTEFAYLLRNGDVSHAIAVLAIDLTQRSIKSRLVSETVLNPGLETEILIGTDNSFSNSGSKASEETAFVSASNPDMQLESDAPEYEASMWVLVKKQMRDWTHEQKEGLLLDSLRKNPIAYTKRLSRIYNFFTQTMKSFVVQVTKDPRHLRKYFSMSGVLRLLTDFSLAGYQHVFEDQLKANLSRRGLLVSQAHKNSIARMCFALSFCLTVFSLISTWLLLRPTIAISIFFTLTIFATIAARLLYGLKELLPYLGDVVQILRFLHRRSWRLVALRFVSRYIRLVIALMCSGAYVIPTFFALFIMKLLDAQPSLAQFAICLFASVVILQLTNLFLRGVEISQGEYATTKAIASIKTLRANVAGLSPLEVFVQMLQSKSYERTFSDLMAIYGIETLLFLA